MLDGIVEIKNQKAKADDFILVENESEIKFKIANGVKLFSIAVPQKLSYKSYIELVNN